MPWQAIEGSQRGVAQGRRLIRLDGAVQGLQSPHRGQHLHHPVRAVPARPERLCERPRLRPPHWTGESLSEDSSLFHVVFVLVGFCVSLRVLPVLFV